MKARVLLFLPALAIELIMLALGVVCIYIKFRNGFLIMEHGAAKLPDAPWYFEGWMSQQNYNAD